MEDLLKELVRQLPLGFVLALQYWLFTQYLKGKDTNSHEMQVKTVEAFSAAIGKLENALGSNANSLTNISAALQAAVELNATLADRSDKMHDAFVEELTRNHRGKHT